MKNILKLFSFVAVFFLLVSATFAINAPSGLKIDSNNGTDVKLSWDKVDGALMYYVYYGTESGINKGYELQSDLSEENSIKISSLDAGKTYYFSVVALDDNAIESKYSNEITNSSKNTTVTTAVKINEVDFALDSIKVIDYNKIELSFTNEINDSEGTLNDFKITNINDNLDSFEVLTSEVDKDDKTKILLTLDKNTEIGNQYEVVILAITNVDGKTIESGIDNIETFKVEEINIDEESIELNSASEVAGPTGSNIDSSVIENTTLAVADNSTNLPKTGPEHILLLILSIVLGAVAFVFKYKKV